MFYNTFLDLCQDFQVHDTPFMSAACYYGRIIKLFLRNVLQCGYQKIIKLGDGGYLGTLIR